MSWLFTMWSVPVQEWHDGNHVGAVLSGLLIYGVTLIVIVTLVLLIRAIVRKLSWLIRRKHCQHCGRWTTAFSDGTWQGQGCQTGEPCCWYDTVHHKALAEPTYQCPIDGENMVKVEDQGLIYDCCLRCMHYFMSIEELAEVRRREFNSGESQGYSSGMLIGMVIG